MMFHILKSRLIFLIFVIMLVLTATNTYLLIHFKNIINSNYATVVGKTGPTGPSGVAGAQGQQGTQGSPGITGPTGATGPQGSKGDTSVVTIQGPQGPMGNTGPVGPQGSPGPQGEPGSPAPAIELRCHDNILQFRYSGDFTWRNLVQLSITESCL